MIKKGLQFPAGLIIFHELNISRNTKHPAPAQTLAFMALTPLEMLQAGVDRAVIALWLGHESVETTQMYLEATLASCLSMSFQKNCKPLQSILTSDQERASTNSAK